MTTTEITVQYERKFSDGNYGSEGLSLSATITGADAELTNEAAIDCAARVRRTVLSFLSTSGAGRVAGAAKHELDSAAPAVAPMSDEAYFDAMADARSY